MKICTRCGFDNDEYATRCKECNEVLSVKDLNQSFDVLTRKSTYLHSKSSEAFAFSWGSFILGMAIPLIGFLFISSNGPLFSMIILIDVVFCITLSVSGKGKSGLSAFLGLIAFGFVIFLIALF